MKPLLNTITYLLNSTLHGGKSHSWSIWLFVSSPARPLAGEDRVALHFLTLNDLYSGHCKKLTPEYAAAAQKLAALDPPRYLAKVDATEHKEVAERHGVKGFPTLVFYK